MLLKIRNLLEARLLCDAVEEFFSERVKSYRSLARFAEPDNRDYFNNMGEMYQRVHDHYVARLGDICESESGSDDAGSL